MSSEFIEGSKHAEMTAAVESHFGTASHRTMPGVASGKGYPLQGDDAWNDQPADNNNYGTGVNYTPPGDAGHTVKAKAFAGNADGLPGNAKKLW